MSEDRINKKRNKDLIGNMTVERATKTRKKDLIDNMTVIKKRKKDVVENLNEDRLRKKREKDVVQNLNEDRLKKKRDKDVAQHWNEDRLRKKKEKDTVGCMGTDRIDKRRRVQQVSKIWPHKISFVDFGDVNYICPRCSAFFWHVEFSKKSCCYFGKVKLSPLTDYDKKMKNLLLCDLNYRQLTWYYNNRFSFASFSANVLNEHKKGIYNLKIQGQVCHVAPNSIYARKDETPYGGQIYIYDDYKATKQRLKDNSR